MTSCLSGSVTRSQGSIFFFFTICSSSSSQSPLTLHTLNTSGKKTVSLERITYLLLFFLRGSSVQHREQVRGAGGALCPGADTIVGDGTHTGQTTSLAGCRQLGTSKPKPHDTEGVGRSHTMGWSGKALKGRIRASPE